MQQDQWRAAATEAAPAHAHAQGVHRVALGQRGHALDLRGRHHATRRACPSQ
jgi:hypothetical protein